MPRRVTGNKFQDAAIASVASWLELEARLKDMQAATMRGEDTKVEALREQCHSYLTIHMDALQTSITLVHATGADSGKPR